MNQSVRELSKQVPMEVTLKSGVLMTMDAMEQPINASLGNRQLILGGSKTQNALMEKI